MSAVSNFIPENGEF